LELVEEEEKKKYISLLERSIQKFLSSFGRKISGRNLRLSQRELEISNMIKSGFSTKEIAKILNVSVFTVQGHRSSIRKKLKIINEKANLATFLQSL
jgi:DNA-binding CsgD family transcriptional regulator